MDRVDLPRGLIRYDTERHMALKAKGIVEKFRLIRPRTIYYMIVIAAVGAVMLWALLTRAPLELHVLHDRNPLFVQLSSGEIRNGYDLKILSKTNLPKIFSVAVTGLPGASIDVQGAGDLSADRLPVAPGDVGHYHIQVRAMQTPTEPIEVRFTLTDTQTGAATQRESIFITQ
jgi:polyferredoxin